jgi:adenylosuccinate synthase
MGLISYFVNSAENSQESEAFRRLHRRWRVGLWVVVGGQFGSEGKGKVSAFITIEENIDICVRCGGTNSGHSFIAENGTNIVLRQLPTGFINPGSRLLLPAGALIDIEVLQHEIEMLRIDPARVGVDRNALIVESLDREREASLKLRDRISSTLSGVGSAVSRRVLRGADVRLFKDIVDTHTWLRPLLTDVAAETNAALQAGRKVLIEGTQGFGLSLYHSPYYPHATSRDTTAAGFLSEVGVSPTAVTEVILVIRTFPIRVAGEQAGPMSSEITWSTVQQESGYPHELGEYTTVTRKLRRVSRFDWDLAKRAVAANGPTRIALTGLDYLNHENRGVLDWHALDNSAINFVTRVEAELGLAIRYLGTGPALKEMFVRSDPRLDSCSLADYSSSAV